MIKSVVFIGAGNVAFHLSHKMYNLGYTIRQVYSRNLKNAMALALTVNASYTNELNKIVHDADLYILALKDDVLPELAKQLILPKSIVVHTSGSNELSILQSCSDNIGVFYPLQSFKKDKQIDFSNVPICLESNNNSTYLQLEIIARKISHNVHEISSSQRMNIHIAAVFLNNFSNYMVTISRNILLKNNIELNLLQPLLEETVEKLSLQNPESYQTGPAKRGDYKLVAKHIEQLAVTPEWQILYEQISESLLKYYNK